MAKEAGVSISTVSNALNGVDVLLPSTKQRVLEAAKKLNYTPNLNGRNLKAQETRVLGLFLTAIRGPFYAELSDSIYRTCQANGYELQIFLGEDSNRIMTNLLGRRVDGGIVMNERITEKHHKMLKDNNVPMVFLDREWKDEHISSIVFDSYKEGEMAARFLLELGHKKFLYVEGFKNNYDNIRRLKGFQDVLGRAGIKLSQEDILEGAFEKEASYNSVAAYVESHKKLPDAIFAANDLSAIGTIEALTDSGIRVPEDISVIGCDDIELARLVTPSVTTIRTSFERLGEMAVEQLIGLIHKDEGDVTVLHGRIIPRDSTAPKN